MSQLDAQQRYDELVRLCYECVLDESKWPELLGRLVEASERQHGALMMLSKQTETVQISAINTYDSPITEAYNAYYHRLDPGYLFMPQREMGHWYHDFIDYGERAIARSPYYQEFHRAGDLGNISCVKLYENDRAGAYLSLLTSWDKRIGEPHQQQLLQRLTPHLSMAGRIAEQLQNQELDLAKRDLLLGQQATPLWLLDESGQVVFCNRAAEQLMMQKGFALYARCGQLHSTQQDSRLKALIQTASGRNGPRRAGWLQLNGSPEQSLLVTPVPAEATFNTQLQQPLVLLALVGQHPPTQLLAELFQLSPAEQRLAELLGKGHSPEQCCALLGVSINTVRTQLRALFRKTRTQRQSELVSLIGRLGR
jgi:DNA-binding CsgD family transcriptional regulator